MINKKVPFSAVPVGEQFEYNGQRYVRFTYGRGKQRDAATGKLIFTTFPAHREVLWVNAYPNQLEA